MNLQALLLLIFGLSINVAFAQVDQELLNHCEDGLLQLSEPSQFPDLQTNQLKFNSELLTSPYVVVDNGIYSPEIGNLFIRIKPLDFKKVTPMPGAYEFSKGDRMKKFYPMKIKPVQ